MAQNLSSDWLWAPLLCTVEVDMDDSMNKEHFRGRNGKMFKAELVPDELQILEHDSWNLTCFIFLNLND